MSACACYVSPTGQEIRVGLSRWGIVHPAYRSYNRIRHSAFGGHVPFTRLPLPVDASVLSVKKMQLLCAAVWASAIAHRPIFVSQAATAAARAQPLVCSGGDGTSDNAIDWDAAWREQVKKRQTSELDEVTDAYLRRLKSRGLPRGHGNYIASMGLPRGVQPVSASAYKREEEESGLMARIAAIRVDAFLLALGAVGFLVYTGIGAADAATLDGMAASHLLSEADDGGGIIEWVAKNAALESAWLLAIALAIVYVALEDPRK